MKLVYLTPRKQFLTKMSRVRFHQIKAISKIVDLIWSGPDWDGYDNDLSVTSNLLKLCGVLPDMLIVFDPSRDLIDLASVPISTCVMMNEMHCPDGSKDDPLNYILSQQFNLVICHHFNEMNNSFFSKINNRCHHIPHSADNKIFKDYGFEKEFDVLVCGNLRFDKYILRRRYPRIIEIIQNLGYRCKIQEHPGGFHDDAHTDRYLVDFAKCINRSKICLTCSSVHKCVFGKYVEIPMCKSLLAGDLPGEREDFFSQFMLVFEDQDSDQTIVDKIISLLEDQETLDQKTEIGFCLSQYFTMENYANRFVKIAKNHLLNCKI